MEWRNGMYLWFLLIIPIIIGGVWWYNRQLEHKRVSIFGPDLLQRLKSGFWPAGQRIRQVCLYLGLAFLIIGAAGPKIGSQVRKVKQQGVDLMIALDLSASMNAEDVKPSRLEKAKYEISRLIDRLHGDRVGLIVYTGEAYLQSPMTVDYSALHLFLNTATTKQMPTSTTDFSAAMKTAAKAFKNSEKEEESSKAAKVLFIISDGENHGESYDQQMKALKKENVSVYTLGMGTSNGGTIPKYDDSGNLKGYKRDKSGKVVTTKLETKTLKSIAKKGRGQYYEIRSGSSGIDAFLGRLDKLQQGEFSSKKFADYKNQYQWLVGIGLLFCVAGIAFPTFRSKE